MMHDSSEKCPDCDLAYEYHHMETGDCYTKAFYKCPKCGAMLTR